MTDYPIHLDKLPFGPTSDYNPDQKYFTLRIEFREARNLTEARNYGFGGNWRAT